MHIATATIEPTSSEYAMLTDVQYKVILKGLITGLDDYGAIAAQGKYTLEFVVDEYATCVTSFVEITSRW